jgi:catechol 2,3-dioxygenase-like lactoylglutathione lyase family enzyme
MRKLQSQGVHHVTLVGADRRTSIDLWEGVLGMPFVFEQPNLDNESESHLYFDPGDGRLGLLIELSSYRFEPPWGHTHADVLLEAHRLRVERGDYNIDQEHVADAVEALVRRSRASLSEDRSPQDPYEAGRIAWPPTS